MLGSILGAIGQGSIWGVMVLGIFITYKVLKCSDLTVDGSFATGGAVFAVSVLAGYPATLALIFSMLAGCGCGFATGFLHTRCRIPDILAGILTQLGLYSINLRILNDKANISIANTSTHILTISKTLGITQSRAGLIVGLLVSIICVIILYFFLGTEMGASIRATGNNEKMIRALGVNTENVKLFGFVISNMLVALSGALLVEMNKYADVGMGKGAIVYGLASIVIGDVLFSKFTNFGIKLLSSVVGCIIFFIIRAIVIRLGLKANDMQLLSSLIVVIALSTPVVKEHFGSKLLLKKDSKEGK